MLLPGPGLELAEVDDRERDPRRRQEEGEGPGQPSSYGQGCDRCLCSRYARKMEPQRTTVYARSRRGMLVEELADMELIPDETSSIVVGDRNTWTNDKRNRVPRPLSEMAEC